MRASRCADGKGAKDRVTMVALKPAAPVERHLGKVRAQHEEDLEEGGGDVFLPEALTRDIPGAAREWAWQYVFPFQPPLAGIRALSLMVASCG